MGADGALTMKADTFGGVKKAPRACSAMRSPVWDRMSSASGPAPVPSTLT